MKNINTKNLIKSLFIAVLVMIGTHSLVEAGECEDTYGGGETCIVNKRFEIEKEVRICEDDLDDQEDRDCDDWGDWEDKVTDVKEGQIIEFRVRIQNLSDEDAGEFDDMRMEDKFPNELERIGGSGFTEYWDDFKPGDKKEFKTKALIKSSEFDRENFEKCIVNKAEVEWDDNYEGSDTATVCYGDEEVTELPKTGSNSVAAMLGTFCVALGLTIRKRLA